MEEKEEKQKLIQKYKEAMRYEHCSLFSSSDPNVSLGLTLKRNSAALYTPTSFLPFLLLPSTVCHPDDVYPVVSCCNTVAGVHAQGLCYNDACTAAVANAPGMGSASSRVCVMVVLLYSCVWAFSKVLSLLDLRF